MAQHTELWGRGARAAATLQFWATGAAPSRCIQLGTLLTAAAAERRTRADELLLRCSLWLPPPHCSVPSHPHTSGPTLDARPLPPSWAYGAGLSLLGLPAWPGTGGAAPRASADRLSPVLPLMPRILLLGTQQLPQELWS